MTIAAIAALTLAVVLALLLLVGEAVVYLVRSRRIASNEQRTLKP